MTIRARLLLTHLALTGFGMLLLAGYILLSFRTYYFSASQADLAARATAISESLADALEDNNPQRLQQLVTRYGSQGGINLRVVAPDGRLLSTSVGRDRTIRNWLGVPGIRQGLAQEAAGGSAPSIHLPRQTKLWEARRLKRNDRLMGVMLMSLSVAEFERQFQRVVWAVLGTVALVFALCAAISAALARSFARPIQAMRDFAVEVGSGHFRRKLRVRRSDELGELAHELNRMSERLGSLDDERRAFLANVSHELRTPVSNVQVTLEALEGGADAAPDLRQRFIRTAHEETLRLSRLIQDLLDLGRLEAGVGALDRQPLDIRPLVRRAARAVESRLQARRLDLAVDVPSAWISGDPERLIQALLNILDNAIKFSEPGSVIRISARVEGESVLLRIRDQGSGINDEDLPHVFEQFYTADPARRRGGTGLGLAIARRIVEAHGGTIAAQSAPERGATFAIRLPLSREEAVPVEAEPAAFTQT